MLMISKSRQWCLIIFILNASTANAAAIGDAAIAAISAQCQAQATAVHSAWAPQVQNAIAQGNASEARTAACGDGGQYDVQIDCLNQFYQLVSPAQLASIRMQTRALLAARGLKPCPY